MSEGTGEQASRRAVKQGLGPKSKRGVGQRGVGPGHERVAKMRDIEAASKTATENGWGQALKRHKLAMNETPCRSGNNAKASNRAGQRGRLLRGSRAV